MFYLTFRLQKALYIFGTNKHNIKRNMWRPQKSKYEGAAFGSVENHHSFRMCQMHTIPCKIEIPKYLNLSTTRIKSKKP